MKRHLAILLAAAMLFTLLIGVAYAGTAPNGADQGAMAAANELYEADHYEEAARLYEQLAAQGLENSALFFNLGNAYYQQGRVVPAILNYQHAAQLAPRDPDIRANLELALAQAPVPLSPDTYSRIGQVAGLTGSWLTLNELAVLALAVWFAFGLLIFTWRSLGPGKARHIVRNATAFVFVLVLVSVMLLGSRVAVSDAQQAIFERQPNLAEILEAGA